MVALRIKIVIIVLPVLVEIITNNVPILGKMGSSSPPFNVESVAGIIDPAGKAKEKLVNVPLDPNNGFKTLPIMIGRNVFNNLGLIGGVAFLGFRYVGTTNKEDLILHFDPGLNLGLNPYTGIQKGQGFTYFR